MTQLKLQDFFVDLDKTTLAQSDMEDQKNQMEDENAKTETNISFHSFKVKKSLDKEEFEMSMLGHQDARGLYSRYSIVSGDRSNTFTAGMHSKGVKSTGKETVSRLGQFAMKDIPFTGFGNILANQNQDMGFKQAAHGQSKSFPAREITHSHLGSQDGKIREFSSSDNLKNENSQFKN
jgi:hypothetical protein